MTVDGFLDCGSCRQPFDIGPRRPKVLPCGHTCCRGCLQERDRWDDFLGTRYFRCPENNKVYIGKADDLLDNSYIIYAIDSNLRSGGTSTSLSATLERSALPLQEELAALPELRSEALAALRRTILHAQQEQLDVLQRLERLRRSSGMADWQQHRKAAQLVLATGRPQKHEVQRDLRLLRGRRLATRPALELRGAGSLSAAAEAELQLEEQPALRLAATLLREQGDLPHVQYKEKKKEYYDLPWNYYLRVGWLRKGRQRDKLEDELLKTPEWLVNSIPAQCSYWTHSESLAVLRRYSATMTCLQLNPSTLEHIAALWEFPALQELDVTLYGVESRATVSRSGEPLRWPPLGPSKARRLWRVQLHMPWSVAAVLLAAHRDSLLEVSMSPIGIRPAWEKSDTIAEILRECDLYQLRSLHLPVQLAREEAEELRAALSNGCRLQHKMKVENKLKPMSSADRFKLVSGAERFQVHPRKEFLRWKEEMEDGDGVDNGSGLHD